VLIQEQLKAVGARLSIEALDFSAFVTRQSQTRDFDAMMGSWNPDPSRSGVKEVWGTPGIAKGGSNYVSYSNPTFDALLDSAMTTFDRQRGAQYAHRAYQTLVDDAPAVWLYDVLNVAGMHKRIHPTQVRADAWWADLPDWSIPANERIDRDRIGLRPAQP
jgi:peptide/nickel transport system substrate-binding protein